MAGRWRVCNEFGCPRLVPTGAGKCDEHRKATRRAEDSRRANSAQRGYGARWRRIRRAFLKANPYCVDCGFLATVADHDPIPRRELVHRGDPNPDAWHHLKPRCTRCHNRRTARDDGGFGRPRKDRHG